MTNPLKLLILSGFGSQQAFADAMGVDRKTVYRWLNNSPELMMKHVTKICAISNINQTNLHNEIIERLTKLTFVDV